jgi:hypothetical protein
MWHYHSTFELCQNRFLDIGIHPYAVTQLRLGFIDESIEHFAELAQVSSTANGWIIIVELANILIIELVHHLQHGKGARSINGTDRETNCCALTR